LPPHLFVEEAISKCENMAMYKDGKHAAMQEGMQAIVI